MQNSDNTLPPDQLEYYQNFDFDNATLVEPNVIQKIKAQKKLIEQRSFDSDILAWLDTQDTTTKRHINEMLRHMMAIKTI